MKIYTKTGDSGDTGLFGGPRVPKDHLRIEAYGTVDELNSVVGIVRLYVRASKGPLPGLDAHLERVQNELFDLGAALATPEPSKFGITGISEASVLALEQGIDRYEQDLEPLKQFILPGGTPAAAYLHLARTVCRRAERLVVALARESEIAPTSVIYLNRLSDWVFVAARWVNKCEGQSDVPWKKTEAATADAANSETVAPLAAISPGEPEDWRALFQERGRRSRASRRGSAALKIGLAHFACTVMMWGLLARQVHRYPRDLLGFGDIMATAVAFFPASLVFPFDFEGIMKNGWVVLFLLIANTSVWAYVGSRVLVRK